MREWTPELVARAAGATLVTAPAGKGGPERAAIDSREAGPGALFVGLPGASVDGGTFAGAALQSGAWGTLTAPEHARAAVAAVDGGSAGGAVLAADDPLAALQALAAAGRRALGAQVLGVTGSVGKTSVKD
ncbi:MAG: Mur ligase domain-containing protein, partial [Solirubrobacteraceae bacterium]